jgi:hypothetical protein
MLEYGKTEETWVDTERRPDFRQEFYPSEEGRRLLVGDAFSIALALTNSSAHFEMRRDGEDWTDITQMLWSIPNNSPVGFGDTRHPHGFGGQHEIRAEETRKVDLFTWGPVSCEMWIRCHHKTSPEQPGEICINFAYGPGCEYNPCEWF